MSELWRPNPDRNSVAASQMMPSVSTATGMKMWLAAMVAYFADFLTAVASEALPASNEVLLMYVAARVSTTVTSHVRHRPDCHGTSVSPSGLLPSVQSRPIGSLMAGMSAFLRALYIRSFS